MRVAFSPRSSARTIAAAVSSATGRKMRVRKTGRTVFVIAADKDGETDKRVEEKDAEYE